MTPLGIPLFEMLFQRCLLKCSLQGYRFHRDKWPDHVGILFNSPGFAQIGQLGFGRLTLFHGPAELRERHHRDIQFFGQGLRVGNARNFLLATLRTPRICMCRIYDDEARSQFYSQAPRLARISALIALAYHGKWAHRKRGCRVGQQRPIITMRKPVRSFEESTGLASRENARRAALTFRG
jgi:hypothetical protein